jgi:hypothetical protein
LVGVFGISGQPASPESLRHGPDPGVVKTSLREASQAAKQHYLPPGRIECHRSLSSHWRTRRRKQFRPCHSVPGPCVTEENPSVLPSEQDNLSSCCIIGHRMEKPRRRTRCRRFLTPVRTIPYPCVVRWNGASCSEEDNLIPSSVVGHGMVASGRWRIDGRHLRPSGSIPDPRVL